MVPDALGVSDVAFANRVRILLDALDAARGLDRLQQPSFDLRPAPVPADSYSIVIRDCWRLVFVWHDNNPHSVDLTELGS